MKSDIEIAVEYQSKFRFYFVALVFTLLAASVQSAPLDKMILVIKILELLGWLFLLVCGLISLSYLEYSAVIYDHRDTIKNAKMSDDGKAEIAEQLTNIQEGSKLKYRFAKYSFVAGLVFVIAARGLHGF